MESSFELIDQHYFLAESDSSFRSDSKKDQEAIHWKYEGFRHEAGPTQYFISQNKDLYHILEYERNMLINALKPRGRQGNPDAIKNVARLFDNSSGIYHK